MGKYVSRGFSYHEQGVLQALREEHWMTTQDMRERTAIALSRLGLITRAAIYTGPVEPNDQWRLTVLGRRIVDTLWHHAKRAKRTKGPLDNFEKQ